MALMHAGLAQASPGSTHAVVHASLAVDWLDRAFDAHDVHLAFLTVDPKWDTFRRHPRFLALLERCPFYSSVLPVTPAAVPGQGRPTLAGLYPEPFHYRA